MKLVIVTGQTSTGKSAIARKLSEDLHIPLCARDSYKEDGYDRLGKAPSLRQLAALDSGSYKELERRVKQAVAEDKPLIIESNFSGWHAKALRSWLKPDTVVVEVFCYAKQWTILKRYIRRNRSGERHRGHRDYLWYPLVALEVAGLGKLRYKPFGFGKALAVDTSDFTKVDYEAIRRFAGTEKVAAALTPSQFAKS